MLQAFWNFVCQSIWWRSEQFPPSKLSLLDTLKKISYCEIIVLHDKSLEFVTTIWLNPYYDDVSVLKEQIDKDIKNRNLRLENYILLYNETVLSSDHDKTLWIQFKMTTQPLIVRLQPRNLDDNNNLMEVSTMIPFNVSLPRKKTNTRKFRSQKNGGVVGLRNLGNTCFFNSVIQCLCHCDKFTNSIAPVCALEEVPNQELQPLVDLIFYMHYATDKVYNPVDLFEQLQEHYEKYKDRKQQDSFVCLSDLLDMFKKFYYLHESSQYLPLKEFKDIPNPTLEYQKDIIKEYLSTYKDPISANFSGVWSTISQCGICGFETHDYNLAFGFPEPLQLEYEQISIHVIIIPQQIKVKVEQMTGNYSISTLVVAASRQSNTKMNQDNGYDVYAMQIGTDHSLLQFVPCANDQVIDDFIDKGQTNIFILDLFEQKFEESISSTLVPFWIIEKKEEKDLGIYRVQIQTTDNLVSLETFYDDKKIIGWTPVPKRHPFIILNRQRLGNIFKGKIVQDCVVFIDWSSEVEIPWINIDVCENLPSNLTTENVFYLLQNSFMVIRLALHTLRINLISLVEEFAKDKYGDIDFWNVNKEQLHIIKKNESFKQWDFEIDNVPEITPDLHWNKTLIEFIISHFSAAFLLTETFWENKENNLIFENCKIFLEPKVLKFGGLGKIWNRLITSPVRDQLQPQLWNSFSQTTKKMYQSIEKEVLAMKKLTTRRQNHHCKSLLDCIKLYKTEEWVKPELACFKCSKCKNTLCVIVRKEILRPPQILVIPLKRTFAKHDIEYKINTTLEIPTHIEITSEDKYEMTSFIEHEGSATGGHYTATVMNTRDDKWYHISDDSIFPIKGGSHFNSKNVIILLYQKSFDWESYKKEETEKGCYGPFLLFS